ncbi:MAG: hypothetical protein VCD00_14815 [Candidatus Hydrogenedentota bacterium]
MTRACEILEESITDADGIDGGRVVRIRYNADRAIRQLKFEMRWSDTTYLPRGKPECEQGINALRWTTDQHTTIIATEDVHALTSRLARGHDISPDAANYLHDLSPELDHLVFGFHNDGLSIRLTEIPKNEFVQLHFVLAWNPIPEPKPEATWLAVNLPFSR